MAGKSTTKARSTGTDTGVAKAKPASRQLQQQQQQPTIGAPAIPRRAITSLQSQYRKMGDLYGAMGKTLTDLGVPLTA